MFLDTLKQAFLARKELFKDLYLENNWDWSEPHPVIHISFGSGVVKDPKTLQKRMEYFVNDHAKGYDVPLEKEIIPDRFVELIEKLHKKYSKKVVILVDEYDKPILDNIENPDAAMSWLGGRVYNPFDILLFFLDMKDFRPSWFETGTPTFLMKLLIKEKYFIPKLEELRAGIELSYRRHKRKWKMR